MNDLDPNYLLPLWQAVIAYFKRYQPLIQAEQAAELSRQSRPRV